MNTSHPRRRALLAGTLLAAGTAALPRAWAQALPTARGQGRLVVVFLRGALDGLSAFVPWSDPDYARLRPGIAIPPPDGSGQSTIRLDGSFGLHPALAMLEPLWREQVLAFVPAAGSPDGTRSHFDAQYQWETARPGQSGDAPGWLNLLAAQLGGAGGDAQPRILGVGEVGHHQCSQQRAGRDNTAGRSHDLPPDPISNENAFGVPVPQADGLRL